MITISLSSPAAGDTGDQTALTRNVSAISTTSSSSSSSYEPAPRPRPLRTYTGPQAKNVPDVAPASPTTPKATQKTFADIHAETPTNPISVPFGGSTNLTPGRSLNIPALATPLSSAPSSKRNSIVGSATPNGVRSRQTSGSNSASNYRFETVLGEGSYSIVHKAVSLLNQQTYAIKIISKRHIKKENKVRYASSERAILSKLGAANHPGIIRLYSAFQDADQLYFVMELAPNGDLFSRLHRLGSFDVPCSKYYGATILDAVAFMHSMQIIHRDLKPENILLDIHLRIKITDFGSAKDESVEVPASENSRGSFVGTPEYASPEMLTSTTTGKHSDIWAFGCVIFQFISGRPPFKEATNYLTMQKIQKGEYSFPEDFDLVCRDLVEKILVIDPSKRLGSGTGGIQNVKDHPFFESVEWATIWKQDPPALDSGLVKRNPEEVQAQIELDWADLVASEDEMDPPPLPTVSTPSPASKRYSRKATLETADENEVGEADSSVEDASEVVGHLAPPQFTSATTGKGPAQSGSSSSVEGLTVSNSSASRNSGSSGGSRAFELVRGVRGLNLGEPQTIDWVLPNGTPLLAPGEGAIYTSPITTKVKRGLLPPKQRHRLLMLTTSHRLLCIKEAKSNIGGTRQRVSIEDEILLDGHLACQIVPQIFSVKGDAKLDGNSFSIQVGEKTSIFVTDSATTTQAWMERLGETIKRPSMSKPIQP